MKGWGTKKLGEVATLQRGFDLPTQDRVSGEYPLVSSSGISDTHHKSAVRGPGVVTGRSGSIGNVFFIKDDFWPLNTVLYIKDFHGNDPRFVFHLLNHFDLKRFATGSGVPTLNRNFVHDELVRVPTSVAEQQRIVGVLDEAFEGLATARANAEKNLQNARALFESHLQAVFTQRGPGWVETTLGKVYDVRDGTHDSPIYHVTGFPLITSKNLKPDGLSFDDVKLISKTDYNKINERSAVHKGDVLFAMIGTIGNPTLVEVEPRFSIKNVALFKAPTGQNSRFLKHYLASEWVKSKMAKEAKGTTQKFVGLGYLRSFPILLPPLATQNDIVEELDALSAETQRLTSLYERKLAALEALKKALLHQAFAGEL
jgi:type I restriction enzyme S subunit